MIKRIGEIIKVKGLSVSAFEKSINASDGMIRRALKNNTDIQSKWLAAISENYSDINANWLLTGNGDMFLNSNNSETKNYFTGYTDEQIDEIIGDRFEKHLMNMLEQGRVIPSLVMRNMEDDKNKVIESLQKKIWELEQMQTSGTTTTGRKTNTTHK